MGALAIGVLVGVWLVCAAMRGPIDKAVEEAVEEGEPGHAVAAGCGGVFAVGIVGLLGAMIAIGLLASQ